MTDPDPVAVAIEAVRRIVKRENDRAVIDSSEILKSAEVDDG